MQIAEMADAAGVSSTTFTAIEMNGDSAPEKTLTRLAEALGVDIDDLE